MVGPVVDQMVVQMEAETSFEFTPYLKWANAMYAGMNGSDWANAYLDLPQTGGIESLGLTVNIQV